MNSEERSLSNLENKIYLTWPYYIDLIYALANKIKSVNISFDYVYGIPRGGMIPAAVLSHELNINLIDTLPNWYDKYKILIVDDIVDSGKSLNYYKNKSNFKTATIFKHVKSPFTPDFYIKDNSQWINFPYEKD